MINFVESLSLYTMYVDWTATNTIYEAKVINITTKIIIKTAHIQYGAGDRVATNSLLTPAAKVHIPYAALSSMTQIEIG